MSNRLERLFNVTRRRKPGDEMHAPELPMMDGASEDAPELPTTVKAARKLWPTNAPTETDDMPTLPAKPAIPGGEIETLMGVDEETPQRAGWPTPLRPRVPATELNPLKDEMPINPTAESMAGETAPMAVESNNAAQSRSSQRLSRINQMQDAPIMRENSFGKRLVSGLWNAYRNWGQTGAQGGLGGLLGQLAVGGATFAASPDMMGEFNKRRDVAEQYQLYGQDLAAEDAQLNQQLRREQVDAIPFNAETRRLQIEQQQEDRDATRQQRANEKIVSMQWFDPANSAHATLAKRAGLDTESLKGWDNRRLDRTQVAGQWYARNRETGVYEPENIPADGSKTLTDYTIQMPNGEKRTYKVTQADAARFSQQMATFGARMNFDKEQAERKDKQFFAGLEAKIAADKQKNQFDKTKELAKLEALKTEGKVDDATYQQIKTLLENQ